MDKLLTKIKTSETLQKAKKLLTILYILIYVHV